MSFNKNTKKGKKNPQIEMFTLLPKIRIFIFDTLKVHILHVFW